MLNVEKGRKNNAGLNFRQKKRRKPPLPFSLPFWIPKRRWGTGNPGYTDIKRKTIRFVYKKPTCKAVSLQVGCKSVYLNYYNAVYKLYYCLLKNSAVAAFCFLFLISASVYSGRCPRSPLPFWCPKRKRKKHRRLRRFFA